MINSKNYRLKIQDIHKLTIQFLCELTILSALTRVKDILNVVIFASTFRTSINQASNELQGVPCSSYVLRQLTNNLQDIDQLEKELNKILISKLPKQLKRKKRQVAIDLVDIPYHGTTENDSDVRRSKAKSGTTHFFSYATAYVILNGNRYTLALVRVLAEDNMLDVLKKLMAALKIIGIKISVLLVDRAFYSVKVIRYLKTRQQAFIMPAVKKGKKANENGGPTCTQRLAAQKKSGRTRYTLTNSEGEKVSFDVVIVCRNLQKKKKKRKTLLYVTYLVNSNSLNWVRKTYRKRFGIESSYRQLNQARIKTTTRNPCLRLFFYALALILRNIWVWLHASIIASSRRGGKILHLSKLPFQKLLLWLFSAIIEQYTLKGEIIGSSNIHRILDG